MRLMIGSAFLLAIALSVTPALAAHWRHWHKYEWLDRDSIRKVGPLTYFHNQATKDDKPPPKETDWKWDDAFDCATGDHWYWNNDFDDNGNPIDDQGAPLPQGNFAKDSNNHSLEPLFKAVCKH